MPDLDHELRTYFDVLADQVEDNVMAGRGQSQTNWLDLPELAITSQHLSHPGHSPVDDGVAADLRSTDEVEDPEYRNGWTLAAVAQAAAVALVVVMGLVLIDEDRDEPVSDLVGGDIEIEVFLDDLGEVLDVDFDPSGQLYIMEHLAGMSTVEIRVDGSAGAPTYLARQWPDAEDFVHGTDLESMTFDEHGVLYFADWHSVYRLTDLPLGATTELLSSSGREDRYGPESLAIDANGDLYVATSEASGVLITRVDILDDGSAGTATEIVRVPGGGFHGDIEFGPTGELFVTSSGDEVWAITFADDGSMTSLRMSATVPGGPVALSSDASGKLYVGTSAGTLWSVEPAEDPVVVATGFDVVSALAFDASGTLYLADVGTGEIFTITTK